MKGAKPPVPPKPGKPLTKSPPPEVATKKARDVQLKDREPTPELSDSEVEEGEIRDNVFPAEAVLSAFEGPENPKWERYVETKTVTKGKGTSSDPRRTKR
jgi:hypothetical protein